MSTFGVMQVVDSLQLGGLESVAVNYANHLTDRGLRSCLCSTRASGPLAQRLSPAVPCLNLQRQGLVDFGALKRLTAFIRHQHIDLLHSHGTSLFYSLLASWLAPNLRVIWHVHLGQYATEQRSALLYRLAVRRAAGVITVNQPLADWGRTCLRVPAERIWSVPNFVAKPISSKEPTAIPGTSGKRIVCVANLRPEKDHLSLIAAMELVVQSEPSASLLLLGSKSDPAHVAKVKECIRQCGLTGSVFLLGCRTDVFSVLRSCDVGVLSSASEGMPLALLEYGVAGLPVVATRVGQVPEMLDEGRAGLLVPPGNASLLAAALLTLMRSAELRSKLGEEWRRRVDEHYSEASAMRQIVGIYETVLGIHGGRPSLAQ